jgi:hypothetical protein
MRYEPRDINEPTSVTLTVTRKANGQVEASLQGFIDNENHHMGAKISPDLVFSLTHKLADIWGIIKLSKLDAEMVERN